MAVIEWMNEDSQEYANVLRLNDKKHPLMATAPGEKIDCLVDEAYIYATKQGKFVVGSKLIGPADPAIVSIEKGGLRLIKQGIHVSPFVS